MRPTRRRQENESQILQRVTNNRKKRVTRKKNKAYQKGYRFERRVMKHFQKLGYYVRRNYASRGAEDLNAMKKLTIPGTNIRCTEVLHVQCKNLAVERKLTRADADRLIALAKQTGGTPLLAFNRDHKLIIVEVE